MGIENWMEHEETPVPETTAVDEPRRHMLGGFRPGKGFAPPEVDENDETLTAPIDVDFGKAPAPDDDDTADAAPFA
jgi:hypothetical protein